MFKIYFKTAWRNIIRRKLSSIINITGLAFGICACLIIFMITDFEFSFDGFHPDKERIYRVGGKMQGGEGRTYVTGCVPNPTAGVLRNNVTGFENVAGFFVLNTTVKVPNGNNKPKEFQMAKSETENKIIVAESQYFTIFQYQWLAGNPATSLKEPFKVVLSKTEAQRYFGDIPAEDVVGKQIVYSDSLQLTVSGIVNDWNSNSDFDFKDFISWSTIQASFLKNKINVSKWSNWDSDNQVFIKLSKNVKPEQIATQLHQFSKGFLKPDDAKPEAFLQPLADIHFNNSIGDEYSRKASLPVLNSLIIIAIFILLIAVINFVNLSTAQSFERSKEIGIRKVLGSNRSKIVSQFLVETLILTIAAVMLAIIMVNPLITLFEAFIPARLTFKISDTSTILFLIIITIVTSLLAGFYPAKILSSYLPVLSLKGISSSKPTNKAYLRKSLIVFQFTVSLLFIIGTLIVGQQINYMLNKDLGFDKRAILNIKTGNNDNILKRDFFVKKIGEISGVSNISVSGKPPAADGQNSTIIERDDKEKSSMEAQFIAADENFLPLYNIKLLAGANYRHSDTINQLLINETAAKNLGFKNPQDAIGKMIFIGINDRPNSSQTFPITGVVSDFNSTSLHDIIKPLFITASSSMSHIVNIKLSSQSPQQVSSILALIESTWKQVYPGKIFDYSFFDETVAAFYDKEQKTKEIINASMITAIFISCMGLFGLITFTIRQRIKEIGIRKTLGASVSNITILLNKDIVTLVFLAIIISSPVAWVLLNKWLQNYPYRITIGFLPFLLAGLAALCIAIITISFQSAKAALANPVKSLRIE